MDINERREALRARVRKKLHGEEEDDELVVKETEIVASTTQGEELLLIDESTGLLTLASSLDLHRKRPWNHHWTLFAAGESG